MDTLPPASSDYFGSLSRWIDAARSRMFEPIGLVHAAGRSDGTPAAPLLCYGTGYDSWGAQTQQKAAAAFAVASIDPAVSQPERARRAGEAMAMLRYTLSTHRSGTVVGTDGRQWGHTWISALGIERLAFALPCIEAVMTTEDRAAVERVLVSEAQWLYANHPVKAGLASDNVPESNIWNGALLLRAAVDYPHAVPAPEYHRRALEYLVNSISIPADGFDDEEVADGLGRAVRVRDVYVGANFFPSMALNHHAYLNVGYMVICLSNIALLHHRFRFGDSGAPSYLLRHVEHLWRTVRTCLFPDGRLLRIGGDTRVRYCYCQDYLIPTLRFLRDLGLHGERPGDDRAEIDRLEAGWFAQLSCEQDGNADGSYLGARCIELDSVSPLYYTRLESDRAVCVAYGALHDHLAPTGIAAGGQSMGTAGGAPGLPQPSPPEEHPIRVWSDEFHGAALCRGPNRIASWTWVAAEGPMGLVVPTDRSDLAEWRHNLFGHVESLASIHDYAPESMLSVAHPDGWLVSVGSAVVEGRQFVAEGHQPMRLARIESAFVALPDDESVVVMQRITSLVRAELRCVKGLSLLVPNDLWNGERRTLRAATGDHDVPAREETRIDAGRWVVIDGRLAVESILAGSSITVIQPGKRQIGLKRYPWNDTSHSAGMLGCLEVCSPARTDRFTAEIGEILVDVAWLVRVLPGGRADDGSPSVVGPNAAAGDPPETVLERYGIAVEWMSAERPTPVVRFAGATWVARPVEPAEERARRVTRAGDTG